MEILQFQRILVFIWLCFLTTGDVCNGVECPAAEKQALLDFKMVLDLNSTLKLSSWNGTDCCEWDGILCDASGSVYYVSLLFLGLQNMKNHTIWPSLTKLKSLRFLDLSFNNFIDVLPSSIGNFHNLTVLRLDSNYFQGPIPSSIGNLQHLSTLSLHSNLLEGPIPDSFQHLQSLSYLLLDSNKLNGSIPNCLGRLSQLSGLHLSYNQFSGVISESLFLSLSELTELSLSGNPVIFNLSPKWVPPFQLTFLEMSSCNLGSFPTWIRSQREMFGLDLSNNNLSGSIPNWLWNMSFGDLDLSSNYLYGHLPNLANYVFTGLDLSYNLLGGDLPHFNASIEYLVLSHNDLSGPLPTNMGNIMPNLNALSLSNNNLIGDVPITIANISQLLYLDLSKNNLTGSITLTLGNLPALMVLDLHGNNLSGEIPENLSMLSLLVRLRLSNNNFSGKIPSSLKNSSHLKVLDLASNNLTGNVPSWVGEVFPNLEILSLGSNFLSGELPLLYSNLTSLQILDLSENRLNGTIPAGLGELKAMAQIEHIKNGYGDSNTLSSTIEQQEFHLNVNSMQLVYTKTLYLVTSIDLSGNNLYGEIPEEITRLVGLVVLNLSRNHICGHIPQSIIKLHQLLSLDLSSNNLSGLIPSVMSEMTFLETLDLSNNNFSGRIPDGNQMMTFNKSSFSGNPGLCGEPINVSCGTGDDSRNGGIDNGRKSEEEETNEEIRWNMMSIGVGFFVGVVGPYLVFSVNRSWGGLYFAVVDFIVFKLSRGKYRAA